MFKGIARLFVATAAGAGLGAGAALARRHLLGGRSAGAPASWTPAASVPPAPPSPATQAVQPPPAAPQPPGLPPASPTDVADLDVARARLRQRAAELRAEMEG